MKKTTAIAMALVLCMMFGGAALAEAPAVTEAPAVVDTVETTVAAEQKESFNLLSWISQGWNTVTETVTSGLDTLEQTVNSWKETVL